MSRLLWGLTLKAAALKTVLGGPTSWEVPKWKLLLQGPAVVLIVPASLAAVLWVALVSLQESQGMLRRQGPAVVLMMPASRAAVLWIALGALRVSRRQRLLTMTAMRPGLKALKAVLWMAMEMWQMWLGAPQMPCR